MSCGPCARFPPAAPPFMPRWPPRIAADAVGPGPPRANPLLCLRPAIGLCVPTAACPVTLGLERKAALWPASARVPPWASWTGAVSKPRSTSALRVNGPVRSPRRAAPCRLYDQPIPLPPGGCQAATSGEYQYFAYPCPTWSFSADQLYAALAPSPRSGPSAWASTALPIHAFGLACALPLRRPDPANPLMLRYGPGGYTACTGPLRRCRLPAPMAIRLAAGPLFRGGEFFLVEQRPRQQSRPHVRCAARARRDLRGAERPAQGGRASPPPLAMACSESGQSGAERW